MPTLTDPFLALQPGQRLPLKEGDNFRRATHVWSRPEIHALRLALAAQRPLLLRGEPGTGKSQLARAAAEVLHGGHPLVAVIHPRFEASELLYSFDTMARLMDAQLGDKGQWDASNERYLAKGVLWQAFDEGCAGKHHPVVLVDEIDKADADVPNSLLDVLANRSFDVPMRQSRRRIQADAHFAPLIIFTTNEERELPAAFVRRCVVLNLNPPRDEDALQAWMVERVQSHADVEGVVSPDVVARAVRQTLTDRKTVVAEGYPPVGLAEAIDLVRALERLTKDRFESVPQREAEQVRLLDELSPYALIKYPLADPGQAREPLPHSASDETADASTGPAA